MEDGETQEDVHARSLRQARAKPQKTTLSEAPQSEEMEKLEKLVANKDRSATFVMMGLFALIGSTFGAIPFVGWMISLVTAGGISLCAFTFEGMPKIKAQALNASGVVVNIVAAVFLVDAIPEQALTVLLTWLVVRYDAHKAEGQLDKIQGNEK